MPLLLTRASGRCRYCSHGHLADAATAHTGIWQMLLLLTRASSRCRYCSHGTHGIWQMPLFFSPNELGSFGARVGSKV